MVPATVFMLKSVFPAQAGRRLAVHSAITARAGYSSSAAEASESSASTSTASSSKVSSARPRLESNPIEPLKPGRHLRFALNRAELFEQTKKTPTTHFIPNVAKRIPPKPSSSLQSSAAAPPKELDKERPVFLKANHYTFDADEVELDDDLDNDAVPEGEILEAANDDEVPLKIPNYRSQFRLSEHESIYIRPGHIVYEDRGHPDGRARSIISFARLRDACSCSLCVHRSTRQKRHSTADMIRDTNLDEVGIYFNLAQGGQMMTALRVKWFSDSGDEQAKQSHSSTYNAARLRALARSTDPRWRYLEARPAKRQFWMADDLANSDRTPTFDYARLQRAIESGRLSRGLLRMLEQLHVYGIAIIKDVPTKNTGNSDCTLRTVANWIGEIRNTFYGETWDVKSVLNSKNIAYTSDNLGLHMDLLYFSNPPRFQLLHCLRNRVEGGSSYFVDSFQVAKSFAKDHPKYTHILQTTKIPYVYDNDNHYLRHEHPVLPEDLTFRNLFAAINWSPPFQAAIGPLDWIRPNATDADLSANVTKEAKFFEALQKFEDYLNERKNRYEFMLKEGDLVLFDNRRVLHARTAFRDRPKEAREKGEAEMVEGEPTRWLKGCYLDGEVVWDKLVVLNRELRKAPK